MGCDIHTVFQARDSDGKWKDVPSKFEEDRHYFLFAWLADVRNGFGFAGIPTHTAIKPICQPRGLPSDFECVDENHPVESSKLLGWREKYRRPHEPLEIWLGDYSHSWLTADEILTADKPTNVLRTGVIPIAAFRAWDGKSAPESWSGGISGPSITVSSPSEVTNATTHVQIEWFTDSSEELGYFIEEIARLKAEYGEVRMLFGFDS